MEHGRERHRRQARRPFGSCEAVGWFFGLTFVISWIVGVVVAGVLQALLPESFDRASLLVAKFGPTLAGLILAAWVSGRDGLLHLLRSAVRLRPYGLGHAVALLTPPFLVAVALSLHQATGGVVDWTFLEGETPGTVLLALATFAFAGGGFGEELGWRGFALPMLQRSTSALRASLVVGAVWAAWHYPALLLDRENTTPIGLFTLFVLAATIGLTWLYNSTGGNVLSAVLFHASFNASESLIDGAVAPAEELRLETWLVSLYVLLAAIVVVAFPSDSLSWRPRTTWPEAHETAPRDRA